LKPKQAIHISETWKLKNLLEFPFAKGGLSSEKLLKLMTLVTRCEVTNVG